MNDSAKKKAYAVELSKNVSNYFRKLDMPTKKRIKNSLYSLSEDPYNPAFDSKPLAGRAGQFRLRVGNYRIIYTLEDVIRVLYVMEIGPRGDVYK